jgi:hypothetical protein
MLTLRGDIFPVAGNYGFLGVCASGNNIYTVTSEPKFRQYEFTYLTQTASSTANLLGSTPSDITLIAPTTACISYSGSNRFDLICLTTYATAGITTGAAATNGSTTTHQQCAGNPATGFALATDNTAGKIQLINSANNTCLPVTPSGGSWGTDTAYCVIVKPDSNTWLVGTNKGKIYEISSAGAILNTIVLPSSAVVAPSSLIPTVQVQTLSYCPTTSAVCAITQNGPMYVYTWPTAVPVSSYISIASKPVLCQSSSGTAILGNAAGDGFGLISEIYFEQGYPVFSSQIGIENSGGCYTVGLENTFNYAWSSNSTTNTYPALRIYNITSSQKTTVPSASQNPPGSYVNQRIIRFRDDGIGTACVEYDAYMVSAGPINLPCTNDRNYIELGINQAGTEWDIREFTA